MATSQSNPSSIYSPYREIYRDIKCAAYNVEVSEESKVSLQWDEDKEADLVEVGFDQSRPPTFVFLQVGTQIGLSNATWRDSDCTQGEVSVLPAYHREDRPNGWCSLRLYTAGVSSSGSIAVQQQFWVPRSSYELGAPMPESDIDVDEKMDGAVMLSDRLVDGRVTLSVGVFHELSGRTGELRITKASPRCLRGQDQWAKTLRKAVMDDLGNELSQGSRHL